MSDFGVPSPLAVGNADRRAIQAVARRTVVYCTSTSRPARPIEGTEIRETDTGRVFVYAAGAWVFQRAWLPVGRVGQHVSSSGSIASGVTSGGLLGYTPLFTGEYVISGFVRYSAGVTGGYLALDRTSPLTPLTAIEYTSGKSWFGCARTLVLTAGVNYSVRHMMTAGGSLNYTIEFDVTWVGP